MSKGTKLSEFEKRKITDLKRVGKSLRKISRPKDAVNCYLQFLEKSKLAWNKKTDWQARKIITTIQEENCLQSTKDNFVTIKNIDIFSGCSLHY